LVSAENGGVPKAGLQKVVLVGYTSSIEIVCVKRALSGSDFSLQKSSLVTNE
jgi:hypothetical protein